MQKMGCVQRVIRLIFSPLRRNSKKSRSPRNTFSVSAQTEISNSSACESEGKSCSKSTETGTEEELRSCREEKHRKAARSRKKRDDDEPSFASESEQSVSMAEEKKRRLAKKKAKNILGESVIVEKPPRKERGRGRHGKKPAEESKALSSTTSGDSIQYTSEEHVSRKSRADAQKSGRRHAQASRREAKRLEMSAIDSRSDTQTDYSFIIDNYIGSDAGVVEARSAYRQKDYSILLKHRLYEYIESLDSHNNQSVSFWE